MSEELLSGINALHFFDKTRTAGHNVNRHVRWRARIDRLLDSKNDLAFKQVFGEEKHKDILLKFLNDALILHGNLITDVRFFKVNLDTEITALRQSIVDVLCRTTDDTYLIVETQRESDSTFIQRAACT